MLARRVVLSVAAMLAAGAAQAQTPPPPPQYGPPITLADAKKAAAAAVAEVGRIGSAPDCIVIVDSAGFLVYLERMDNTQYGSVRVAVNKARTAVLFRRPSKVFEDALAGGRAAILGLPGVTPLEGGVPILVDGKLVGAIGASGGTGPQDSEVAAAGAKAVSR